MATWILHVNRNRSPENKILTVFQTQNDVTKDCSSVVQGQDRLLIHILPAHLSSFHELQYYKLGGNVRICGMKYEDGCGFLLQAGNCKLRCVDVGYCLPRYIFLARGSSMTSINRTTLGWIHFFMIAISRRIFCSFDICARPSRLRVVLSTILMACGRGKHWVGKDKGVRWKEGRRQTEGDSWDSITLQRTA